MIFKDEKYKYIKIIKKIKNSFYFIIKLYNKKKKILNMKI